MKIQKILREIAKKSKHHRYKHAAIVGTNKKIYGVGINNSALHAEVAAICNAGDCKGLNLYTMMIRKDGNLGNGKPCSGCMRVIKVAKIKKVFYYVE